VVLNPAFRTLTFHTFYPDGLDACSVTNVSILIPTRLGEIGRQRLRSVGQILPNPPASCRRAQAQHQKPRLAAPPSSSDWFAISTSPYSTMAAASRDRSGHRRQRQADDLRGRRVCAFGQTRFAPAGASSLADWSLGDDPGRS
jgi:hypothetical protein